MTTTTTNTKPNTKKLLSQLANAQSSGCIWVESGSVSWKIYLQEGSLKYVYCSLQSLDQLKYYLRYLGFKHALAAVKKISSSDSQLSYSSSEKTSANHLYSEVIGWLLEEKYLNSSQNLQLIKQITQDALSFCLWSNQGNTAWKDGHFLPLWIIGDALSINVSEYLAVQETRREQWQNCSRQLLSVHQRPYFASGWEKKLLPDSGLLNRQNLQELTQIIKGHISIRQLSLLLRKDELNVAKILSPYIDNGIVSLRNAQPPLERLPSIPKATKSFLKTPLSKPSTHSNEGSLNSVFAKVWKIVCIDDSPTILTEIQRFLSAEEFEVTAINDPVQAVPIIFRLKPDLILLDITMPRINGYRLCGLLRGSEYCDHTPIIMVTGNTGFIDKARAKIAGATDYLTKPFTKQGLTQIVTKHLM